MNRLQCIAELRDCPAMRALADAIEIVRDQHDRWRMATSPEETAITREILGSLIELQVRMDTDCVRLGASMPDRLSSEILMQGAA